MNLQERQGKIYFALNNPIRCLIIEFLKSYGALSSSDLAGLLQISLSRCYYHLENLAGLVNQDNEQRYLLSKDGISAFQLLVEPKNSAESIVRIVK